MASEMRATLRGRRRVNFPPYIIVVLVRSCFSHGPGFPPRRHPFGSLSFHTNGIAISVLYLVGMRKASLCSGDCPICDLAQHVERLATPVSAGPTSIHRRLACFGDAGC